MVCSPFLHLYNIYLGFSLEMVSLGFHVSSTALGLFFQLGVSFVRFFGCPQKPSCILKGLLGIEDLAGFL